MVSLLLPARGSILALALLSVAAAAGADEANLLTNPSFEQVDEATGCPLHWSRWTKTSCVAYTLARARDGVASALITDRDGRMGHGLRSAAVKVTPGTWYEAEVHVRIADREQGGFALYLEFWNAAGVRGLHKIVSTEAVGRWTRLTARLQAPPDAATATVLVYGSSVTIGAAYFDQAALLALPSPNPKGQAR